MSRKNLAGCERVHSFTVAVAPIDNHMNSLLGDERCPSWIGYVEQQSNWASEYSRRRINRDARNHRSDVIDCHNRGGRGCAEAVVVDGDAYRVIVRRRVGWTIVSVGMHQLEGP